MAFGKIKIEQEYRPCFVGERRGLFHLWIEKEQVFLKPALLGANYESIDFRIMLENGIVPADCEWQKAKQPFGIVEFEDGIVEEIEPSKIRFVPGLMTEYDFTNIEYR